MLLFFFREGHRIVALANLRPPDEAGQSEIDSYMYQSVGHSGIEVRFRNLVGLSFAKKVFVVSFREFLDNCRGYGITALQTTDSGKTGERRI